MTGYVYFLSANHYSYCGYFKVGITRLDKYKKRIQQIQSCSPFDINVECVYSHSDPECLEAMVLDKFKEYRIRGEWFCIHRINTPELEPDEGNINSLSIEFCKRVKMFIKSTSDGEQIA